MTGEAKPLVSAAQKAFFDKNGYVVLPGFFSAAEIAPLRVAYDQLVQEAEEAHDGARRGQVIQRPGLCSSWEDWKQKAYVAKIVQAGGELLGDDIRFWYDQIIMKPGGVLGDTPWHQDAGYWRPRPGSSAKASLAAERAVTSWLALSEVTEHHGCMQFIPESHLDGLAAHDDASKSSVINGALEVLDVDASKAVTVTMQAGDISFHHCRTLHYTTGNDAQTPRRGLVTHLAPEAVLAESAKG